MRDFNPILSDIEDLLTDDETIDRGIYEGLIEKHFGTHFFEPSAPGSGNACCTFFKYGTNCDFDRDAAIHQAVK